ncbi:MAG: NAD(+) diphosphatase [Kangiellaceae bacterium]|nr:NAD(+) diphosphatase [Kangiellaceae bacterium]
MLSDPMLQRHAELRQNTDRLNHLLADTTTKFLISHKGRFICHGGKPIYFDPIQVVEATSIELSLSDKKLMELTYLGGMETQHYFLLSIKQLPKALENKELLDLRTAALGANAFDADLLFYSQGLSNWHFSHAFCEKCGSKTISAQTGHSRICCNLDCAKEHFPRIEPAVIFSIQATINNTPKILLARQANWPEKRYSVIAGFAEHGESLEHAVAREALEEVGLVVNNIKYISSQPWPFPASLMLGFTSETKQHDICLVDEELEHAQWLSAKEIKSQVEQGELLMPYSVSISWYLVDLWYQAQTGVSLRTLNKPSK